jgi:DNA polymerase III subunit epsilon
MKILGIDLETTGLDFTTDRITEIGAVLWDTSTGTPLRLFNTLVRHTDAPPITPEIERLTGITQEMIDTYGVPIAACLPKLFVMMSEADAIVAHNGTGFDRPMLAAQIERLGKIAPERPWIDTATDVPYPPHITTRKLVHLAAEHGFLNPFAHRAQFDVLTMLRILQHYDIHEVLDTARQPSITLIAQVSYDDREKAKSRGYRWHDSKTWRKTIKLNQLEAERASVDFAVAEHTD